MAPKIFIRNINSLAKALFCLHKEINKNNSKAVFFQYISLTTLNGGVSGILKNKICLFFLWHGLIILIPRMRILDQNVEEFCFSLAWG